MTAIVLAIFLGALFGLVSVQTGMVESTYAYLDKEYPESGYVYTLGSTYSEIADFTEGLVRDDNFYEGLPASDIIRPDGTVFQVLTEIVPGMYSIYYGMTLYPNDAMKEMLSQHEDCLVEGRWVQNPFEMCVDVEFNEKLNVNVGDVVTRQGHSFTVVGVYDEELLLDLTESGPMAEFYCAHICTLDVDTPSYQWSWNMDTAKQNFETCRKLQAKGFDAHVGWIYEDYYNDIIQLRAVFTAVDVVFAIVIVVALYSLVSVLFRQRKTQICRLKILGASDATIAGIYCGIVIVLMLATVLLATALGVAFNNYFMDLCADMMGYPFVASFNVYAPFVAFASFGAITFALWMAVNRRMKNNLATEIRYE